MVDMIVPMVMTLLGRITDVSDVHDSKALLPKIRVRVDKGVTLMVMIAID